jgi:hypothetical protein
MRNIVLPFTLLAVAVFSPPIAPAQAAGVARTFVSAAGSDGNNCINVLTPCRHLATAFAATAQDGEIYVLDPANYGSLTITHGVSIEGHGWASIAPVAGQAAITINAPGATDKINIIGVVLDGTAITNTTGIQFSSGGTLSVEDCVIRNFANDGISFKPNTSTPSQLFVSNALVSDNGVNGIVIEPSGAGAVTGVLDHVRMRSNVANGLLVQSDTVQTINVTVSDSVSANNHNGIEAVSNGAMQVNVMVRNSTIANSALEGLNASGTGAAVRITRSTITGNAVSWFPSAGGVVLSYSDNNIDSNTSGNGEPPNPLVYH